jgi:hypothetical protein
MRTLRVSVTLMVSCILFIGGIACAGTEWNSLRAGNPVLPGYFADPCCRKFGDTYYIYVTPDGWDVGRGPFCIWSSKDFVNWTSHKSDWPSTEFKWAPSVVEKGGKYYMYNSTPCMIWGAVADTPLGPWKSLSPEGKPMIPDATPKGSIVLDGECFIDADGQIYIWYSTWWTPTLAKMMPDMCTIDGTPRQYFKSVTTPNPEPGYTLQGCMEAPYMLKRNGIYYLMYSNMYCADHTYKVEYSTATSPTGPFTYGKNNPILETNEDDTVDGPGHHTILEDGDKIYIVYHRHDNPHSPGGAYRQTCIDPLYFEADGSIAKVVPSHSGVGYLAPSTKRDTNLAFGKPATASASVSPDFAPNYATDENNGTLWKAPANTFPQWLQVDLGQKSAVKRIETEFQYAQVIYSYLIESSDDGKTWATCVDRKANKDWGPVIDNVDVSARYFKITILGKDTDRGDQGAAIWGFKLYDGIDKPNQAPVVDLGPDVTGTMRFPKRVLDAAVHDKESGPGDVTFEYPDRSRSKVTFSAPGTYVLTLTADDGELKGTDRVTYNILPPDENLIWYKFDEKSGTIANDSFENGQYGVMPVGTVRSFGMYGGAVNLDGNTYVSIPSLGEQDRLTIAAWVSPHTLDRDQSGVFCSNTETERSIQATIAASGEVRFAAKGLPAQTSDYRFSPEDLGLWKHVAIVYDGAAKTVSFYIDGKLDSTRSYAEAGKLDLSGDLRIGGAPGVRGLDGEVDDFRVYAKALSAPEIAELAKPTKFAGISEVKKLADGSHVLLMSKVASLAPQDPIRFARTTDYFYVSERDGSAGIRVEDGAAGQDSVRQDVCVSLEGVVKTTPSGEKCVALDSFPTNGAPRSAKTRDSNVKAAIADQNLSAVLVKLTGDVGTVSENGKRFTIVDPQDRQAEIKAVIEHGIIVKKFAPGNTVEVTGIVSTEGSVDQSEKVILVKELTRLNPPPSPMIALYRFDETDGTVAHDSSGNDLNATLVNSPQWAKGMFGNAIRFDGDKSYLQLPDLGIQTALTVSVWLNMETRGKDELASSIMHCDSWTDGDLHYMVDRNKGDIVVAVGGTGDLRSKFMFTDDYLGKWVHVALVYDSKARTLQLYINGEPDVNKGVGVSRPINLSRAKIGTWGGGSRMFNGMMDDFRFYDKALTQEEIAQVYKGIDVPTDSQILPITTTE